MYAFQLLAQYCVFYLIKHVIYFLHAVKQWYALCIYCDTICGVFVMFSIMKENNTVTIDIESLDVEASARQSSRLVFVNEARCGTCSAIYFDDNQFIRQELYFTFNQIIDSIHTIQNRQCFLHYISYLYCRFGWDNFTHSAFTMVK